jgi:serine/threonine-protein kinase/endoribonuclease IRE1
MNNFFLFAAAILFLPWLVEAQQQHRPAVVRQRQESPHEALEQNLSHKLDATKIRHSVETPAAYYRRKNTNIPNEFNKNDASAIATLAPAEKSAVAAPPPRRPSITAGLSSPHIARNIGDWEVEDFVLLATVDGKLHARDRKTGQERWELSYEQPMVQTKYHNRSSINGYGSTEIDDYLWIVEPSRDGTLYIYRPSGPNPGLVNTGLTMKKLVEDMSPYGDEDPPVMYTGEKKTNLMTIDANTGKVLSWFGTSGAVIPPETCNVDDETYDTGDERCPKTSTLTVGRTEYTVAIQGRDGHSIATLTFSEWSPNNFDADLSRQYSQSRTTLDNKYIYSGHDGSNWSDV